MRRDPTHITSVVGYGRDDYAADAVKLADYRRLAAIHGGDAGMRYLNLASECATRMRAHERRRSTT